MIDEYACSKIQVSAIFEKLSIGPKINIVVTEPCKEVSPLVYLEHWESYSKSHAAKISESFCKWQKMYRYSGKCSANYDVALFLTR